MKRVAVVVVVVAAACDGGLPGRGIGPLIHLAESAPPNQIICARAAPDHPDLASRECAVTVDATAGERSFSIFNRGDATLSVDSVVFADDGDAGFTLIDATRDIEPGERGDVIIGFERAPDFFSSALTIGSNAENDPVVVVDLATVPGSASRMEVSPAVCDFGAVVVGATGFCDLSIDNVGTSELVIVGASFGGGTSLEVYESAFPVPTTIAGGSGVSLRIAAHPLDAGTSIGSFFVESLDETIGVPLQVTGVEPCVARIASVNGVLVGEGAPSVQIGDDVELSSDRSFAPRPGGTITSIDWNLVVRPVGSSALLSSTTEPSTRLTFDLAGTWEIGLVVIDDLGAAFSCGLDVDVVAPAPSVFVRLSGEGDLHVARDGLDWCSDDDCWADNPNPDWGGGELDPLFDPVAPTGVTFTAAPNEAYTIAVGLRDGTGATLRLFIGGQLEGELVQAPNAGREWLAARIQVTNGIASVITLDDVGDQPGDCWAD
ncbi:MAG: choice-of-anchor D domain-containing protein [Deltaproteobacteria bacterium]|nr:choice-of-anchor D domain-containing protein [Deltaproteobacteria bacterium]